MADYFNRLGRLFVG